MSYDVLPYPSLPLLQTHPDRMATVATLLGLSPRPVDGCRVLELGCASGGNLLAMAQGLPNSRFVGIDLSPRQIADGNELVKALGVTNVELIALDIAEMLKPDGLAESLGEFDYIIAHGVYSWVPEPVREALLAVCRRLLSPQGLAYVSYNTYPGFYKRQPIREMMQFHVAMQRGGAPGTAGTAGTPGAIEPRQDVQKARLLLDVLEKGVSDQNSIWGRILAEEAHKLRGQPDAYVGHEHLEDDNRPFYFHEFVAAAGRHGLKFLTEAGRLCTIDDCTPSLRRLLGPRGDDILLIEQYLDFVRNQSLRRTLLVRQDVSIDRSLSLKRVKPLWASCAAFPPPAEQVTAKDVRQPGELLFRTRIGPMKVTHPAFKSVLIALSNEQPRAQRLSEVTEQAAQILDGELSEDMVADMLLEGFRTALLNLHVHPPQFTLSLGERPVASPLARLQARRDPEVANLIHEAVKLNPLERLVLPLLDGKHDRAAMLPPLIAAAKEGILVVQHDKKPVQDEKILHEILAERLDPTLESLAGYALLLS